jgi:hypothetical protein
MRLLLLALLATDGGLNANVDQPPSLFLPPWGSSPREVLTTYRQITIAQTPEGLEAGAMEQSLRFDAFGVTFDSVVFKFNDDKLVSADFFYKRSDRRVSPRDTFESVERELDKKYGKIEAGRGKCRTVRRDSHGVVTHVLSTLRFTPAGASEAPSGITDAACGW